MKRLDGVCDYRQAEPGVPMVNNKLFMGHDKQYDYVRRRFGDFSFCPEYEMVKESYYCKKTSDTHQTHQTAAPIVGSSYTAAATKLKMDNVSV